MVVIVILSPPLWSKVAVATLPLAALSLAMVVETVETAPRRQTLILGTVVVVVQAVTPGPVAVLAAPILQRVVLLVVAEGARAATVLDTVAEV